MRTSFGGQLKDKVFISSVQNKTRGVSNFIQSSKHRLFFE